MNATTSESFEDFVVASVPRLRQVAYACCHDWHRADDLVQDTLERLYVVWGRVIRHGDVFGYARVVLVRRFISEQRRPWRRREHSTGRVEDHDVAATDVDTGQRLDLLAALAALPPRQRAVAVLRFVEDVDVAEVAEITGCSEGTVESQTSHARRALQQRLRPPSAPFVPTDEVSPR